MAPEATPLAGLQQMLDLAKERFRFLEVDHGFRLIEDRSSIEHWLKEIEPLRWIGRYMVLSAISYDKDRNLTFGVRARRTWRLTARRRIELGWISELLGQPLGEGLFCESPDEMGPNSRTARLIDCAARLVRVELSSVMAGDVTLLLKAHRYMRSNRKRVQREFDALIADALKNPASAKKEVASVLSKLRSGSVRPPEK